MIAVLALIGAGPLGAQQKKRPKDFTNGFGMKFVWIEPGSFLMGSPGDEPERNNLEIQHRVKLTRGFYMGAHPVTQQQWGRVFLGFVAPAEGFNLATPSRFLGGDLPVETVSWNDCQEFFRKMQKKDKLPYRLPTEAEWEYACRAGTTTPFHFGATISVTQANYCGETAYRGGAKGIDRKRTTPVGSFPPNAWGLYDMHGNVAQWCQDQFDNYPQKSVIDPQGPSNRGSRVLRGGSWEEPPGRCRSAARAWDSPNNRGEGGYGFRACFFPPESE
jgi:formylglycine-generating enzyme required for sulfatase activity